MGETVGDTYEFEYGINFHDNPQVDGMNLCNQVRDRVSDCGRPSRQVLPSGIGTAEQGANQAAGSTSCTVRV